MHRFAMPSSSAMGRHLVAVAAAAAMASGGCLGNTSGSTSVECRALTTSAPSRPAGWTGTVFTIVMENHSAGQIIGNTAEAPFINSLIKQGAVARGYHDDYVHPSEPNYFFMVAGENFGVLNDNDPDPTASITSKSHIADQLEAAGMTWKTYQESMGEPCGLVSNGTYAVKHNPFAYFSDINGSDGTAFHPGARCRDHIVDYSELEKDLASGKVPDYVFITPNLIHDMHDGSTADGDAWLAQEVPKILASEAFKRGGVLFLLWDEGGGYPQADDPPFIVVSPHAKPGYVSQTSFGTRSYLKTVQAILGVEALPCSTQPAAIPTMDELFTLPVSGATGTGAGPAASPDGGVPTGTGP
jgi:phospholipase C